MLKFFADENIAPRTIEALRKAGYGVTSVYEQKLSGASDEKILRLARSQKRIILTHDKDFGNLIRQPYQPHSGVILLRLRNQSPRNVITHLIPFLQNISQKKIKSRLIIFREGNIRIS